MTDGEIEVLECVLGSGCRVGFQTDIGVYELTRITRSELEVRGWLRDGSYVDLWSTYRDSIVFLYRSEDGFEKRIVPWKSNPHQVLQPLVPPHSNN